MFRARRSWSFFPFGVHERERLVTPVCCREQKQELAEKLKAKAQELAEQFKADWQPVAENLDRAMKAFDDLEGASLHSAAARPIPMLRCRHMERYC
jgi:hypothetical protein